MGEKGQRDPGDQAEADADQHTETVNNGGRRSRDGGLSKKGYAGSLSAQLGEIDLTARRKHLDRGIAERLQAIRCRVAEINLSDTVSVIRRDAERIEIGVSDKRRQFLFEAAALDPIRESVDGQF